MKTALDVRNSNWLIDYFGDATSHRQDKSFAFVLGSGASVSSGIPTGATLVRRWLKEIQESQIQYDSHSPISVEEWATASNLRIEKFDYARHAEFYADVFEARFKAEPEEGYFQLEQLIENKEPAIGYVILAEILTTTRHRVVVTTNFDNLVTDALALYSKKNALVCGHESLAQFARINTRRPLVAKVHRDILLAPGNTRDVLERVRRAWHEVLHKLFSFHTPIVIGYGGNDGSLMKILEGLNSPSQSRPLIWCYHEPDGMPSEHIQQVLRNLGGVLVPTQGFDDLMIAIAKKIQYRLEHIPDKIRFQAGLRAEAIQKYIDSMVETRLVAKDKSLIAQPSSPFDPHRLGAE